MPSFTEVGARASRTSAASGERSALAAKHYKGEIIVGHDLMVV